VRLPNLIHEDIVAEVLENYRSPVWLRSVRGQDAFVAEFEDGSKLSLKLSIVVEGAALTSSARALLLGDIFDFLCVQVPMSKKIPCARICLIRMRRALHVVDHLLLKSRSLELGVYGFRALSSGNITDILLAASRSAHTVMSLYDWKNRLCEHLKLESEKLTQEQVEEIHSSNPLLELIPVEQGDWTLGLTRPELRRARAVLMHKKLYKRDRQRRFEFEYRSSPIAKVIFDNTLYGVEASRSFPLFAELCIGSDVLHREFHAVPVGTMRDDDRCSEISLREYSNTILASEPLAHIGIGIPLLSMNVARELAALGLDLKSLGRTAAVPPPHIAEILSKAIPFFVDHCEHILLSTASVLRAASEAGVSPERLDMTGEMRSLLMPETATFGVTSWAIGHGSSKSDARLDGPAYAGRLREGTSLLQMAHVAFGAMGILVGAMTFGRQGELGDIRSRDVDAKNYWVTRRVGKTGHEGYRLDGAFPVPKVVVDIYLLLKRFFEACGKTDDDFPLFSIPTTPGTFDNQACRQYAAVDTFLDFVQGPRDSEGRRYYLRQHQLRGAMPTLFFYSSDSPDVDALRWALGHTTPKEIWTYISQVTPGAVLQSTKANAVAHLVKRGNQESLDLARAVLRHLGVSSIDVFTTEELASHLEQLMQDGELSVTPIFATGTSAPNVRLGFTFRST
jgi:hypothetical protein